MLNIGNCVCLFFLIWRFGSIAFFERYLKYISFLLMRWLIGLTFWLCFSPTPTFILLFILFNMYPPRPSGYDAWLTSMSSQVRDTAKCADCLWYFCNWKKGFFPQFGFLSRRNIYLSCWKWRNPILPSVPSFIKPKTHLSSAAWRSAAKHLACLPGHI